jgi:hypothetical protein
MMNIACMSRSFAARHSIALVASVAITAAAPALLGGCSPRTVERESWRSPDAVGTARTPIVVLASTGTPAQRQASNAALADALTKEGVEARSGRGILPSSYYDKNQDGQVDDDLDAQAIRAFLFEQGFQSALVVTLEDFERRQEVVRPEVRETSRMEWDAALRSWVHVTTRTQDPVYAYETTLYRIVANLYDLEHGRLTWQVRTETVDPRDLDDLVDSFASTVIGAMQRDAVIGGR